MPSLSLITVRARLEDPIPAGLPAFSGGHWPTGVASSGWVFGLFGCFSRRNLSLSRDSAGLVSTSH
jgi:hypothetical protein